MLDTDTRRRIDTARDILVGKVPDPKSQVEQITIALIYKFMDDMDAKSEELGGDRTFFAGDFARYGWPKLMHAGLGGFETLNLYAEAIAKMPENPGIPRLFRDIFKNAYLPYRDPETLRMFLKVIDEFDYDHSEKLGDAFEYLLSVLGSQGDAGQFRTPRHIIDFMVAVVNPQKNERVLDPACGTAGFLISSYKHILAANRNAAGNSTLTPAEKAQLAQNFTGYDISPDMVRLSLVNMYLHGFADPHIFEYDTLSSEEKWNEYAEVILANPPFMSPKGGIVPHKRFSVQSKRSEVLFVDYMAEHLTPNGRAAIIVPEGIIFQSQTAYKQLRETLIKDYLIGVISLPSGVFMPYTGVKTSILVLDRVVARRNPDIMFSEVKHIGMSLGVKRTPSEHNDLPFVFDDYQAYYEAGKLSRCSWLASRSEVLANGSNLTGSRYKVIEAIGNTRWATIGETCTITKGQSSSTATPPGPYPLVVRGEERLTSSKFQFEGPAVCVPVLSLVHGRGQINRLHYEEGKFAVANLMVALQPLSPDEVDAKYLFHILTVKKASLADLMQGAIYLTLKPEDLAQFSIPLPPLEVQREIVAEIEGYQKVIDGARAVVANYRPHIPIDPAWPLVALGEVMERHNEMIHPGDRKSGELTFVGMEHIEEGTGNRIGATTLELGRMTGRKPVFKKGQVVYGYLRPYLNKVWIAEFDGCSSVDQFAFEVNKERAEPKFVATFLRSDAFLSQSKRSTSSAQLPRISIGEILSARIPLPPLATQQAIVAEIEAEQAIVNANRELIARFEKKIQATLARVWGEEGVDGMNAVDSVHSVYAATA